MKMLNKEWFENWKKKALPLAEEAIRGLEKNVWQGRLPTLAAGGSQARRLYELQHAIARRVAPEFGGAEWPEIWGIYSAGSAEEVGDIRRELYRLEHAATGRPLDGESYPDGYDRFLGDLAAWLAHSAADMAWGVALRRHYLGREEGAS